MTEPDVALTDYGLAVGCAIFAVLLARGGDPRSRLRPWFVVFFAAAGVAPLLGGTVHGFFLDESSIGHAVLWPATLLAIGVAALAGWAIGARLLLDASAVRWIDAAAALQLAVYSGVVLLVTDAFWVAVANYLPAALFLLGAFALAHRRRGDSALAWAAWGLALTFVAAGVQQLQVAPHPVYFNHNAFYHVLQAGGLALIFVGARALVRSPTC